MSSHLEDPSGGLDPSPLCRFANVLASYIPSCTSLLLMKAVAFGVNLALLCFSWVDLWCTPGHCDDGDGDFGSTKIQRRGET